MNERNKSIDCLKCIMAFLVVVIHCHSVIYDHTTPILRGAVPVFFLISGYCINAGDVHNRIKKSLVHILRIFIWSSCLYGLFFTYKYFKNSDIQLGIEQVERFFLFNDHPFIYHLWYINAYLYVLIIMFFITLLNGWKKVLVLSIPLFSLNLILGRYSEFLLGTPLALEYQIPFLFCGLPFFLVGMQIREYIVRLSSFHYWGVLALFSTFGLFIERQLINNAGGDLYICTIFQATSYFMFFYLCKKNNEMISEIGRKYSLYIYILHPLVIDALYSLIHKSSSLVNDIYIYISPFIIFGLTLCLSSIIYRIKTMYVKK